MRREQVMGTWVSWMYGVPDTFICCCFLVDVKQSPFPFILHHHGILPHYSSETTEGTKHGLKFLNLEA